MCGGGKVGVGIMSEPRFPVITIPTTTIPQYHPSLPDSSGEWGPLVSEPTAMPLLPGHLRRSHPDAEAAGSVHRALLDAVLPTLQPVCPIHLLFQRAPFDLNYSGRENIFFFFKIYAAEFLKELKT